MSLKTNINVSENAKNAFQNARNESTRFLKLQIKHETFELVSTEPQTGTSSIDFKKIPTLINAHEPCVILYREKEFTLPSPWIMIVFVPDSADVNSRMLYAASKGSLKDALGRNAFSKIKDFSTPDEVTWKNIQTVDTAINNSDPKPWSQREISIQDLNSQENQARNEYMERNNNTQTDSQPTGFSQITLPITPKAEQSLNKLKSKQVNWVQLTLGDEFNHIDCVNERNVSENDLANNITFNEPQFYLYNLNGSIILIYCCPEDGSNIKNRMVYSTCKATLADQIRKSGVPVVKKFDVRTKDEVNINNLKQEIARKVSSNFRATEDMIRGNSPSNRRNNSPFKKNQNQNDKEPDYNEENANISSKLVSRDVPQQGTAYMIQSGDGKSPKQLPKGVVLPPPGAYC